MQNKRGFTLVELLAAVVILGIIMMISIPAVTRWIDRSKSESKESMKKTLVMATQSYAQANKDALPKVIGQTVTISAESLKDNQYLKEELQDADKNSCMSSYVKVYKSDKNKYTYTPYVICEGDTIVDDDTDINPTISISFYGNESDDELQNVSVSSFKAVITGGTDGTTDYKLDGYSYSVSVKYTDDVNEKSIEIFSSGNLSASGKESIVIEKSLEDYTDITKVNEFIVTVDAYNQVGGYYKLIGTSIYHDTTPPVCGTITGQATDEFDYLTHKGDTRSISVLCSDGEGSGCIKEKFTKTFDTEIDNSVITIEDNAGNKTDCPVRVNIDWTNPTVTIAPFKRTGSGGKGASAGNSVTASHSTLNNTITLNTYYNMVNSWLNYANYPYGVYYEITFGDNVALYTGQWSYNSAGIYNASSSQLNSYGASQPTVLTSNTVAVSLSDQGMRRAKYVVSDKAGNKTSIYINANIDRTNPRCGSTKSNRFTRAGVTINVTCSDSESKCASWDSSHTGVTSTQTYTVRDNAGNTCSTTMYVSSYSCDAYRCNPYQCNCYSCNCEWNACPSSMSYYGTHSSSCCNAGHVCQGNTKSCKKCCSTCYHTCYHTCYE